MVIVLWEIVGRQLHHPTIWAHDMGAFLFGSYAMLAGAYTLRYKAHIRVDILLNHLPWRTQAIMELVTSVFFFAFCIVIVWRGGEVAWDSLLAREFVDSVWAPPLYPYKIVIALSGLLILLQGMVKFMRDVMVAASGKEAA